MSCPYLTEVTMSFCRAFPVKKLVPSDRVITDSPCDGEAYGTCSAFREVTARKSGAARHRGSVSSRGTKGRAAMILAFALSIVAAAFLGFVTIAAHERM